LLNPLANSNEDREFKLDVVNNRQQKQYAASLTGEYNNQDLLTSSPLASLRLNHDVVIERSPDADDKLSLC
jgi:hypothetical protein